eukprot:TRINITY_DN896_c0_g1_i3.p1 TRINITY_DN896_c0_g1~~TRINITY_DN896_c0_g1_i3.p1  ORF type:complete len:327 (-),score=74.72 TRINITY_DN896_c0_g1_i3:73-1053(-)
MLLLPGVSMIAGGIKYKQQKFNQISTGVSSIMLFIAVVGMFSPTIFYHAFGRYEQNCDSCDFMNYGDDNVTHVICIGCHYSQQSWQSDPLFSKVRILMYFTAALLPLSYFVGLLFTTKTHSQLFAQIKQEEEESIDKDDNSAAPPSWSISWSVFVLAIAMIVHALVARDVIDLVDDVLNEWGVNQPFLGITVIAMAPAITELTNAIKFALNNQLSLSFEISSSSAIQTAHIQFPILIILTAIFNETTEYKQPFHLIFPILSVYAVILAVIAFNYILGSEGNANYFLGASLVSMYFLLIASFFFVPEVEDAPSMYIQKLPHVNFKQQ